MESIFPTAQELKDFFLNGKTHATFPETVEIYRKLRMHANKEFPTTLIHDQRPFESWEIFLFRKKIYKSKTSNPIHKVMGSLSKMRRSQDWMIKWPEASKDKSIVEEESLQQYCEKNFPIYDSVVNWAFSIMLRNQCIDPNCYIGVWPESFDLASEADYFKPVATIFNADQVLYKPDKGDYCVLRSTDKVDITDTSGKVHFNEGSVFYVITPTLIARYEQTSLKGDFEPTVNPNPFGVIPVWKIRGVVKEHKDNSTIQLSRLDPMVESLDEAAREYSDLQAVKLQHAFPLFWYVDTQECANCKGTGYVLAGQPNPGGQIGNPALNNASINPAGGGITGYNNLGPQEGVPAVCRNCNGKGTVKFSPYMSMAVKPNILSTQNMPLPPAGYVQRDINTMQALQQSVDAHLYDAMASVNMQFMEQVPLNNSGKAKEIDKDELNNFVYSFSEDFIASLDKIFYWLGEWRHYVRVPDAKARKLLLPEIPVPEKFDLLSAEYLIDELSKARQSSLSPTLLAAIETEYAAKKFYNNIAIFETLQAIYDLDPLPGIKDDMKMIRLNNRGITQSDYVVSCNIEAFVKRAMKEDKNFLKIDWSQQVKVLKGFAQEKIDENSTKQAVMQMIQPAGFPSKAPNAQQPAADPANPDKNAQQAPNVTANTKQVA